MMTYVWMFYYYIDENANRICWHLMKFDDHGYCQTIQLQKYKLS